MIIKNKISYNHIYFGGLVLLTIGLSTSVVIMSISQFILSANWIAEGSFKQKIKLLKKRKSILLIISVLLIHVLWITNSYNYSYAINDLRIKLPFLVLPLIIGTSKKLEFHEIKKLLLFLVASILTVSIIGIILFLIKSTPYWEPRNLSPFISHIRFSLLINLCIFSLVYFSLNTQWNSSNKEKTIYFLLAIILTINLFLLKAFTGIVIFFVTLFILGFVYSIKIKNLIVKLFFLSLLIAIPLLILTYISHCIKKFYTIEPIDYKMLETTTPKGNTYSHNINDKQIENGNYIWLYVCESELRDAWNTCSKIHYDSLDKKGQPIKHTLIRYLTSKGLRKDANGILQLSNEDIKSIEAGNSNYIFNNRFSLYPRIYQILWEFDVYNKGISPSGHSVTLRIEYVKAALSIIKNNIWFGVGTGDVQDEFNIYYKKYKENYIDTKWQRRAHNQFLTFLVSFGIIGFILILCCLVFPIFLEKKHTHYLTIIFLLISFLSMLNEDTLETQAGVTFFVFFYCLFILAVNENKKTKIDS